MHILLSALVSAIVYVQTFKSDFTEENLAKVFPAMVILALLCLILVVSSVMKA